MLGRKISKTIYFSVILSFTGIASLKASDIKVNSISRRPAAAGDYACLRLENNQPIEDIDSLTQIMNVACDKKKSLQILQKQDATYAGCCVWL